MLVYTNNHLRLFDINKRTLCTVETSCDQCKKITSPSSDNKSMDGSGSKKIQGFPSSDGRVIREFASEAVDSGLIPSRVKPTTV